MADTLTSVLESIFMSFRALSLLALAQLAACAGQGQDYVTANQQAVVGGATDFGADHAVVIVVARSTHSIGICTGSLITPRIVMTAGHCVPPLGGESETWTYSVYFADSYNHDTKTFSGLLDNVTRTAIKTFRDPGFRFIATAGAFGDMSLLLLDKDPPDGVVPLPFSRYRVSQKLVGKTIRMVGFGDEFATTDFSVFKKLTASNTVDEIATNWFTVNDSAQITCEGDSGGPAFLMMDGREVVQGITSFGDPSCSAEANWGRVDLFIDEIDAFIAANDPQPAANCGADGICGTYCKTVDPDCPCQKDGQCTTACPDNDLDPDCPLNCGKDNTCQPSGCPTPDPDCGTATTGATCTKNSDCAGNLCVSKGSGMVCTEKCGTNSSCPTNFSCTQPSNICMPASGGGGCSCSVTAPGRGPGLGGWLAFLGLLGVTVCKSRRARRS
jgi:MYXO-CTERM domain-containing protein